MAKVWKPRSQGVSGFVFAFVVCWVIFLEASLDWRAPAVSAIVAVGVGWLFYWMTRVRVMGHADEVFEGDGQLVAVHGGVRAEIPLAQIDEMKCSFRRDYLVRIHLSEPCALGSDIIFQPKSWLWEYPPWFDLLNKKIKAAKEDAPVAGSDL